MSLYVGIDAPTEASMKMAVIRDAAPRASVNVYRCFRGTHRRDYGGKYLWNVGKPEWNFTVLNSENSCL
jgi:hypothetical protein